MTDAVALDDLFKRLHLANARRIWRDLCVRAEKEQWSYEQLLSSSGCSTGRRRTCTQ